MNALSPRISLSLPRTRLSRTGYIFISVLLIVVFEGAVRKWISSSVSLPLIALRDLLALFLIFHVWKIGHFRARKMQTTVMLAWSFCVIVWGMLQVILNDGSPLMLLIGLRFWLLYVWFGFAAASSMTEVDFRATVLTGTALLVLLAPLAVLQYASPPGARINTEVDSVEDEVFTVISGVVRTTGTFSFTSGYTNFLGLVIPLAFAVIGARKRVLKHALFALAAFVSIIAGTLVSGSRTAIIFSGILVVVFLIGRLVFSRNADKGKALVTLALVLVGVGMMSLIFQSAIENTQQRFGEAAEVEDFWLRLLSIFIGEPTAYENFSWIGIGIGQLSNLAGFVRTGAFVAYTLAESEAGRVLIEGGLLGGLYAVLKVGVIAFGLYRSLVIALRKGSLFPLLLWMSLTLALMSWQAIGQLTSNAMQGLSLAFALASLRFPTLEIFPRRASSIRGPG